MPRAVRFDEYGGVDVLHVAEVKKPRPGEGQILVHVRAAGVNPGESAIRSGALDSVFPARFPEGQGTELAGIVDAVGPGVQGVKGGDAVVGWSDTRGAQADYAILPAGNILRKPDELSWDQAAVVPVAAATAVSVVAALNPQRGETLVVAGASGGVGIVTCQLTRRTGARVIGTASERNHDFLRSLGVDPTPYGEGVENRIRALAPEGIDAFADCHGDGNVDLAVALGVSPDRINTIVDFGAAERVHAKTQGMYQLASIRDAVEPLLDMVAAGRLRIPVKARYTLDQVHEAYERLKQPGDAGRVVLEVSADD